MTRAHSRCHGPEGHVCQVPSGLKCVESGCDRDAGTLWGPSWCPEHDEERLARISREMQALRESFYC